MSLEETLSLYSNIILIKSVFNNIDKYNYNHCNIFLEKGLYQLPKNSNNERSFSINYKFYIMIELKKLMLIRKTTQKGEIFVTTGIS